MVRSRESGGPSKHANITTIARWRIPYGNSGLLDAFLMIASSPNIDTALMVHVLRMVGNSCADTDENRARVVSKNGIKSITNLLSNQTLIPFAIPVLFNVCYEYEPAQKQASESGLGPELINLASNPSFEEYRPFLGYACRLLGMLVQQPEEPTRAPESTVAVLFALAASKTNPLDAEDFISCVSTAKSYLADPRFQHSILASHNLDTILSALHASYALVDADEHESKQLSALRDELNTILSDISDIPQFATLCTPNSQTFATLKKWLGSQHNQLQVCGAIMLGNLVRSDAVCTSYVQDVGMHIPLLSILQTSASQQTLYAALGFLKNLALPAVNKIVLGEAGLVEILPRIWAMDSLPQIQYGAVSLARVLITGVPRNVERITSPLSEDVDSPAHERSKLSLLTSLFGRTDTEPVKMEISRLICAVCRVLRAPNLGVKGGEIFFAKHNDIAKPISFMVTQKKWPAIRSEGWFILAMLARNNDAVGIVDDILRDPEVFNLLTEALTSESASEENNGIASPVTEMGSMLGGISVSDGMGMVQQEPKEMAAQDKGNTEQIMRVDRENCLILVTELLRKMGGDIESMRKGALEGLVRDGGSLHMSTR